MIHSNHAGQSPKINTTAFIHPSAVVIGNVQIGANVFVGPNAVIRADEPNGNGIAEAIIIESGVNVQDGVIIHALGGTTVRIGKGASLAHGCVVHGPCDVGENCFIGFNSVVFNATLGPGVVILHQALVDGVTLPAELFVASMTAVHRNEDILKLRPVTGELTAFTTKVRNVNTFLAEVS